MPNAVITVAGITPPGVGKKQGKVSDTTGGVWNVWGDKLHLYRMGVSYDITYEDGEFNGRHFKTIKTANPTNAAPAQATPQPQQHTAPPPSNQNKDEMIFVCGALNNALSNPNAMPFELTAIELATFVKKIRQVWRATIGNSQQSSDDDMNDSVPF